MKNTIIILLAILLFTSCKKDELDGECNRKNIFNQENLNFGSSGGKITIKAKDQYWWINDHIYIDNKAVWICNNPDFEVEGKTNNEKTSTSYDCEKTNMQIWKITGEWLEITRESFTSLSIEVEPNKTGSDRTLSIDIQAGNCFFNIKAEQSAD